MDDNAPSGCGITPVPVPKQWDVRVRLPIAGTTKYELAAPLFDRAQLQLGAKKLLVIAENQAPKNCYVQSVMLNDEPLDRTQINHDEIANGGTLKFVLGPKPVMQPILAQPYGQRQPRH